MDAERLRVLSEFSIFEGEILPQQSNINLSEIIAGNFGANATYVETLLARWRSDPALVDESWRAYFEELVGLPASSAPQTSGAATMPQADGGGTATAPAGDGHKTASAAAPAATESKPTSKVEPQTGEEPSRETTPIRGAALKIVENMEASLAVPTAT